MLFRRRADDLLVATLEAGAVTFAAFFVALEIRHGFNDGDLVDAVQLQRGRAASADPVGAGHDVSVSGQANRPADPVLGLAHSGRHRVWPTGTVLLVFNPMLTGAQAGVVSLRGGLSCPGRPRGIAIRRR